MELCSVCGKNPAVIFLNAKDKDGKSVSKGYCLECAQKQGINPCLELMLAMSYFPGRFPNKYFHRCRA